MNKILKTLRKHWTRVWLIAILLLSGGVYVTYAIYTEVSSVKRVVSTQASPVEMFSSNCMRPDISSRRLSSVEYSITVCNFDQDKPTIYNPATISYTLHAELQVKQGDNYINMATYLGTLDQSNTEQKSKYDNYLAKAALYSIYKTEDDTTGEVAKSESNFTLGNGFTVTLTSDTLAAQHSSVDKYKVEIDSASTTDPNPDIFVHVWAVPTPPTTLRTIETRLYGASTTTDTATWTGTFIETDCAIVDYDFYNYVITGSGAGTVDIIWDSNKFSINDFFFNTALSGNSFYNDNNTPSEILDSDAKYGSRKYDGKYVGWSKITLSVGTGANSQKNRYELQLYKTATDSLTGVSYTGENAATNYIACFFSK
ncbi:hypothetical protein [Ruminococcus sp.]|uniref:hypothetical protein n=1 Tax=Ruminococcus sp. TaxID=41978 RepID=UPI0025E562F3|nr:hypothetical protein [Ruminococcus sp.]